MQSPNREGTAHAAALNEPQKILELGNGLELWKVPPSALRELDVNARSVSKAMFDRLSQTVARDNRLESLPLCAKTERGLEIISGHHRVRAATAAGLSELFAIVDTTELTRSQIAAKQLAHNAIQGQDKVEIEGLDIDLDFKTVLLIFLPRVKERPDRALEYIRSSGQKLDGVYIAADSDYAPLEKAVRRISGEYDVRVVADIIGKMADLALESCGVSVEQPERIHLKDILGTTWIPKEAASTIGDAVQKMIKAGDIGQTNRWQALEYWAADYLGKT